jgi:hypothetical protein
VTELYWGTIDGDVQRVLVMVVGQHNKVTLFNVKCHGDEHVVFCMWVCEELGKVLLRILEGTRTTWKNKT